MSRLLFLLAVAIVVYLLLKSYQRQAPRQDRPAGNGSQDSEEMVRCEQCGVHLPRSESFMAGGKFFCSDEHRRQYNAK